MLLQFCAWKEMPTLIYRHYWLKARVFFTSLVCEWMFFWSLLSLLQASWEVECWLNQDGLTCDDLCDLLLCRCLSCSNSTTWETGFCVDKPNQGKWFSNIWLNHFCYHLIIKYNSHGKSQRVTGWEWRYGERGNINVFRQNWPVELDINIIIISGSDWEAQNTSEWFIIFCSITWLVSYMC
jgi:hypothetical protein